MSSNDENPRREAAFFTTIRSWGITRGEHGVFGGVVEGIGDRIGMDRVPARLIAVVLLFVTGGLFLALYAAAWALLPDREGRIIIQDFGRGTPNVGALLMIALFALMGGNSGPNVWFHKDWRGFPFGVVWGILSIAVVAGVIALIVTTVTRRGSGARDAQAPRDPHATYAVPPVRDQRAYATPPASSAAAGTAATAASPAVAPVDGGDAPIPAPAPAPRPRTPGPGSAIYLLVLSALVFAAAAVWFLDRDGRLAVPAIEAWFAVAVVVIGAGIMIVGALGRRVGFLGFLATLLIVGWAIGLAVVPRVLDLADNGVTFTIDGVTHTVGGGHGWYDSSATGVTCRDFDETLDTVADAPRIDVARGRTDVTVATATAILTVAPHSSLRFESDGDVTGSVSYAERNITCELDRAEGQLYSTLDTGELVTVHLTGPHATIVVEER